jgi:oligosaccharide translocation protein RFT1
MRHSGSLPARMLFQPCEDASRVLFARLTASTSVGPEAKRAALSACIDVFEVVMRFVVLVGLLFATFGANYAYVVVDTLLGAKWSSTSAPTVLAAYCGYVLLLALNGMSEAFVFAVVDASGIRKLNVLLGVFFVAYACVAFAALPAFGTVGLVLASSVNMSLRIAGSWVVAAKFLGQHSLGTPRVLSVLPSRPALAAFVVSFCVMTMSRLAHDQHVFRQRLQHVGVGVCCFGFLAGLW